MQDFFFFFSFKENTKYQKDNEKNLKVIISIWEGKKPVFAYRNFILIPIEEVKYGAEQLKSLPFIFPAPSMNKNCPEAPIGCPPYKIPNSCCVVIMEFRITDFLFLPTGSR